MFEVWNSQIWYKFAASKLTGLVKIENRFLKMKLKKVLQIVNMPVGIYNNDDYNKYSESVLIELCTFM